MQFREIPYLWRKDMPDCVRAQRASLAKFKHDILFLPREGTLPPPPCLTIMGCLPAGGVGGHVLGRLRAGTGSRPGRRPRGGAAHGHLQDAIVRPPNL